LIRGAYQASHHNITMTEDAFFQAIDSIA
jgi:hypothetical protein